MSLVSGQSLSYYEILGPLGAGAMGEVYRARDTRLDREVAIKVLPAHFLDSDERRLRFEREAKLLATLNHSNVAQIYGVDQIDDTCFIVLELVEGESLDARLKRGPLPVPEAIDVGRQIAEGLEAAHEAGVIHRDLKPANVRVAPDGQVKVLDFGLAKSSRDDPGATTTDSALATAAGRLLGTPTYMAPEQAQGKLIDRRVDIWALGCVLYECLTGRRLFDGESLAGVLAAVLQKEPDLSHLPDNTPAHVRDVIARCLSKDPRQRLRDAGDARLELTRAPGAPSTGTRASGKVLALAFAAGVFVTGVGIWSWLRPQPAEPEPVVRFSISDAGMSVDAFQGLALSPNGRHLVFRGLDDDGRERLHLRSLDEHETRSLPGTELGWLPFFAPDGKRFAFFTLGELKEFTLATGHVRTIGVVGYGFSGGTWLKDDTIVFTGSSRPDLYRIPATGGAVEILEVETDLEYDLMSSPYALPGDEAVVCAFGGGGGALNVGVYTFADRSLRIVAENGFTPAYGNGHILYHQAVDGPLMALPFDAEHGRVTGSAFPVAFDLRIRVSYQGSAFSVSRNGTFAYVPRSGFLDQGTLVWVDRQGKETTITRFEMVLDTPRLSHDAKRIAFRAPAPECSIWVHDLERGATTRVTHDNDNHGVTWSVDDREIIYASASAEGRWSIVASPRDGSAEARTLSSEEVVRGYTSDISPDGKKVLLLCVGEETQDDIRCLSLETGSIEPFLSTRYSETGGAISSDGKYVAYVSEERPGLTHVFVRPFDGEDVRYQISIDGGDSPTWSPDGRELYFRKDRDFLAAKIEIEPVFRAGRPEVLFSGEYAKRGATGVADYDVHPDGERFLFVKERAAADGRNINVVLGWYADLAAAAPEHE